MGWVGDEFYLRRPYPPNLIYLQVTLHISNDDEKLTLIFVSDDFGYRHIE